MPGSVSLRQATPLHNAAQRYTTVQTAAKGKNRCTVGMDFQHLWLHVISLRYVTKGHSLASEGEG